MGFRSVKRSGSATPSGPMTENTTRSGSRSVMRSDRRWVPSLEHRSGFRSEPPSGSRSADRSERVTGVRSGPSWGSSRGLSSEPRWGSPGPTSPSAAPSAAPSADRSVIPMVFRSEDPSGSPRESGWAYRSGSQTVRRSDRSTGSLLLLLLWDSRSARRSRYRTVIPMVLRSERSSVSRSDLCCCSDRRMATRTR